MSAAFETARDFAAHGHRVLPTTWVTDGRCSCGKRDCRYTGKHPLTDHGVKDAAADERTLLHLDVRWPHANWAVACGTTGLAVIDIDPKAGGDPAEIIDTYGLAGRPIAWTGEAPEPAGRYPNSLAGVRGAHIYCAGEHPGGNTDVSGVEVRGVGLYAMLAGSRHASGVAYEWHGDARPWNVALEAIPEPLTPQAAGTGDMPPLEPGKRVPHGERHPYLKDFAVRMARSGVTDMATMVTHLRAEFEARCDPNPPAAPGYFEELAGWAVRTRIADRERARGDVWTPPGARDIEQPTNGREAAGNGARRLVLTDLSTVRPERVRWLWHQRVPLGALTLLAGKPKQGKSTLAFDLAAEVTRGTTDGDLKGQPCGALVITFEDHVAGTVVPRLLAANADLRRIRTIEVEQNGDRDLVSLPGDVDLIANAAVNLGARLLVIDPVMAALTADTDSHRDAQVRRVLAPLSKVAEEHDIAVVAIMHLNKRQGGDLIDRISSSVAFTAAARSLLLFGADPHDERGEDGPARVLAQRGNLAATPPSLAYRIEPRVIDGADGEKIETSRLVYVGEHAASADELLAARGSQDERSELEEAEEFLRVELAGNGRPAAAMIPAAKKVGISEVTLRRAKRKLKVKSEKDGMEEGWRWVLPEGDHGPDPHPEPKDDDHLRENSAVERDPSLSEAPGSPEDDQAQKMITFGADDHLRAADSGHRSGDHTAIPDDLQALIGVCGRGPMGTSEVQYQAQRHGVPIPPEQVPDALDILAQLGLVTRGESNGGGSTWFAANNGSSS